MKCTICKSDFRNGVVFPCPECSKEIARCLKCKSLSVKYKCQCGFEGP